MLNDASDCGMYYYLIVDIEDTSFDERWPYGLSHAYEGVWNYLLKKAGDRVCWSVKGMNEVALRSCAQTVL